MEYISLEQNNLEFKNIVSGPAPVGRILNYLKLVGKGKLKHKNGYRNLDLDNNIGYAWTTEFMFGLGLVYTKDKEKNNNVIQLSLTEQGVLLYDFFKNKSEIEFDENNDSECKQQVLNIGKAFYKCFKDAFMRSVVY